MTYVYDLENGQRLIVENDADNTLVALSSGGEGQQQSQATGFDTGAWSKAPTLFRSKEGLVLRIRTRDGSEYFGIRGSGMQRLRSEPDLEDAEELKLRESDETLAMKPMKSIEPMKPMEGMKAMRSMRPMEMRMGSMHMSMGEREEERKSEKRFCTQCGKPAQKTDRFCGHCGNKLTD
jgi:hypothetical protein